ncbi:hypothetical protein [Capnocytophaga sp.]|uniref:hypothetical protein n=1 Tax=Capnocytophaga sp. TaxID=44737 RepID=UPI0026DD4F57|nr:hypothetical protein [Capnocytophaga sp.]MDO5104606.1 hypothetical protein [Capnocytophaga sp.]
MNKKIITLIIALFAVTYATYSQQTTESPYSYYGIGELNFDGTVEERAMGGIGVYADSTRVNMQNPAALSKLKYTAFSAGISFVQKNLSSNEAKVKSGATGFNYIYLGFPIVDKWGVAAGLLPFSSVGYKLAASQTINNQTHLSQFEGKGNVNQAFLSSGYDLYKGLSVGFSLKYHFGYTEMNDKLSISNVDFFTQEYSKSIYKGLTSSLGLYYEKPLKGRLKISSSLVYTPQSKLTSTNERIVSTFGYAFAGQSFTLVEKEKQVKDLNALGLAQTKLTLPSQLEIGFGIGEHQKWLAAVEYTHSQTKNFANPFLSATNVTYENGYKISVGGFYIPQHTSFTNYFKRITYRAGLRYEKTGIVLNNESINDFGISFGVSLPVRGFSNVTTSLEYGKKGTLKQNLIKENYLNLRVGFTLNDKWFQRTKYQ